LGQGVTPTAGDDHHSRGSTLTTIAKLCLDVVLRSVILLTRLCLLDIPAVLLHCLSNVLRKRDAEVTVSSLVIGLLTSFEVAEHDPNIFESDTLRDLSSH